MAVGGGVVAVAVVGWLVFWFLLRLPLLTLSLAVAVLFTALVAPLAARLRRAGASDALSASLALVALLAVLTGMGFLVGFRVTGALQDLTRPLAASIDRIRVWLIEGPLELDPRQVADARNQIVTTLFEVTPTPTTGARMGLYLLGALVLVAFLVFFLVKDGRHMWGWFLRWVPGRRRAQVDGAGRTAWGTLSAYVRGSVVVALIDAVGIGAALLVLGVPLWLSLTLLIFLSSFVPLFGATLSGAAAVLVTLVTNGFADAAIVLVVVLVVQQVEGNLLQPLIMGRALHLHPVAILVAVTAGTMLFGIPGALLAVPVVATTYRVTEYLRDHPAPSPSSAAIPRATAGMMHAGPATATPDEPAAVQETTGRS